MERILQYLALIDKNEHRFLDSLAALLYRHLEKARLPGEDGRRSGPQKS